MSKLVLTSIYSSILARELRKLLNNILIYSITTTIILFIKSVILTLKVVVATFITIIITIVVPLLLLYAIIS